MTPEIYVLIKELADELEALVEDRYPRANRKKYSNEKRRYLRDIEPVLRARKALAKARG